MSNTSETNKFPKITNYTRKISKPTAPVKCPISPTSSTTSERETKRPNTMDYSGHDKILTEKHINPETPFSADQDSSINTAENNKVL